MDELNRRYASAPWECFGNEARSSLLLRAGLPVPTLIDDHTPADFKEPDLARFLVRPSLEPIVYSSWNRFIAWNIDNSWAVTVSEHLSGSRRRPRSVAIDKPPAFNLPPMAYARLEDAKHWLAAIDIIRHVPGLTPLQEATLIHATVVLYHPLDDGNGRLARALFHALLCNRSKIDAPFLAIGPIFYKLSFYILKAIRDLSNSGNWQSYLDDFFCILDISIYIQELMERNGRINDMLRDIR